MVSDEKTATMVRELRRAGWAPLRTTGSHSRWKCPTGKHGETVPDGHRTISAGVVRKIRKAIAVCDCGEEQ